MKWQADRDRRVERQAEMRTERQKGGKSGRQADRNTEGWKGRQTGSKRQLGGKAGRQADIRQQS